MEENLYQDCQLCGLSEIRNSVVWSRFQRVGDVTVQSDLMALGEAPGETEDVTGLPFVGESGKLFELMCRSVGLTSHDFYITNIVKCRPPKNRKPTTQEVKTCKPWLEMQLAIVQPKIILCLGGTAGEFMIGKDFKITKDRGKIFEREGRKVIATFHPSYLMRYPEIIEGSKKWLAWQDMVTLRGLYDSL